MATKRKRLPLAKHEGRSLVIPPAALEKMLNDNGENVAAVLEQAMLSSAQRDHDIDTLLMIINWVDPQRGLSPLDISRLSPLVFELDEMDREHDQTILLSPPQIDILADKLINPNFRILNAGTSFHKFILNFEKALGKSLGDYQESKNHVHQE